MDTNYMRRLIAAGFLTAAAIALPATPIFQVVPAAHADGGIPDPQPDPAGPVGAAGVETSDGPQCSDGEVAGSGGNCVPGVMAAAPAEGGATPPELLPRTTQDITTASDNGGPSNVVPNINGEPCTGYWQSVACSEMDQDTVADHPRSTLSSSP